MKPFFTISIIFFFSLFAIGQENTNAPKQKYTGPFIDASLGWFANPPEELTIHGRASLSAGFQYHHFALGIEGLAGSRGNAYSSTKFSGYGIIFKYTPKHFIFHTSIGKTTNGDHIEDNSLQWSYQKPNGTYFKFGGAYRFAGGALYTGMSFTRVKNIHFELDSPDGFGSGNYPRLDKINDFVFSLDLGFTFPGKR